MAAALTVTFRRCGRCILIGALIMLLISSTDRHHVQAQAVDADSYDVFITRSAATTAPDTIYFVSVRSGLSTPITLTGKDYRLLGDGVAYQDRTSGQLQIARPDGQNGPLGFIDESAGSALAWAVSSDQHWIVWTLAHTSAGSVLSDMYIAQADGSGKLLALHTSAAVGSSNSGLYPIAISNDGAAVIFARQSVAVSDSDRYAAATDVYRLDLSNGQFTHLLGEPRCLCGVTFSADERTVLRLDVDSSKHAVTAHFVDTLVNTEQLVNPFPTVLNWQPAQAGDALLTDKGTLAVYTVANGAFSDKRTQYALILVDMLQRQQRIIIPPRPDRLRPVAFTRGGVILVGADKGGSYRLTFTDGTLTPIASSAYLGTLNG